MENSAQFITNSERLEFRQIVLGHIKKILEISSHELRDCTQTINHGNFSSTTFQEDTRYSYLQAIENLSYILLPYFDKQMQDVYTECIKIINGFGFEVRTILKQEFNKISENVDDETLDNSFVLQMKIKYAKRLFCELNLLLHRTDYLKDSVYGEGDVDNNEVTGEVNKK